MTKKDWKRRRKADKYKPNEYTKETLEVMPSYIIWVVMTVILLIGAGWAVLAVQPAWMGFQREIVQESPQYVESKRTLLNGLVQDWNQLEVEILGSSDEVAAAKRGQQLAIINRMVDESDRLPESEVPSAVTDLLTELGR